MKPESLGELVDRSAVQFGNKSWLTYRESSHTFEEAARRANHLAAEFGQLGVQRGDRVVFVANNSADLVFAWLGLAKAGGTFVPLNPQLRTDDLSAVAGRAEPKLIVLDAAAAAAHPQLAGSAGVPALGLEELAMGRRTVRDLPAVSADDVAVFINTSGTTGLSKLVMQTHRTYLRTGEAFPWWLDITASDRMLTALPLFHLNAQVYSTIGSLTIGAGLVLLDHFSARQFWTEAAAAGATQVNMIGAMIEILMRQPESPADRDHAVRLVYTAPALPRSRHLAIERRFGFEMVIGYAMSESPFGTIWPRGAPPAYESMGTPRQHPEDGSFNELRLVDDAGCDVTPGEVGEILLRNSGTMEGYYNMPDETSSALREGWLHTGDLARRDSAGYFYFVARKKDIIRRRGENLSPVEVENALGGHPDVAEAAVLGVPSELSDEDIKAFVVLRPGTRGDAAALREWAADHLASYQVPRYIEFLDELPHTPTGRVAKHKLSRLRTTSEHDLEAEP